ncbi:hypothetical protein KEM60_00875 [Austwickia sp. TVS 96-490-7B]|uniref:hypothetical protein n=1 Tax=Austwickia sp. TVS 96-490-7B TaxID=2830843 RepID=UPI001C5A1869|nr:hypothetical protein [Austwickia sp. TVS 96-490-7B]MBW3084686.1 hypothetical protein [Austwickia sp. TVS 96-490-7B]
MNELPLPDVAPDGTDAAPALVDVLEAPVTRALRAAISTRGASLESLRLALAERGSQVSVATLSYWRSGRSRPDRGGSMIALSHLEEVLRLPAGFLTSKVTPRGPGSAVASGLPTHYRVIQAPPPGTVSVIGCTPEIVRTRLVEVGMEEDDGLDRVSYHDRLEIRPDRTDGPHDVRTVFVARRPGVDRYPIWYAHDDRGAFPFVMALSNCRLGVATEFPENIAVAAEMLLDHSLAQGESTIVEHRLESIGQTTPLVNLHRGVTTSIRELVMEVRFPSSAVPREAFTRCMRHGQAVVEPARFVGNSLHLLAIDPEPGLYGLEWVW